MKTNMEINERIEMLKEKIVIAKKDLDVCQEGFAEWLAGETELNTFKSRCTSDSMLSDIRLRKSLIDSYFSRIEELRWTLRESTTLESQIKEEQERAMQKEALVNVHKAHIEEISWILSEEGKE